jgi:CRP-like cAMP-binding protein
MISRLNFRKRLMEETVSIETKIQLIKKQNVFSKFTDEETKNLAAILVEQHFKTGATIVTEGDYVDSVYIIVSGRADVRHNIVQDGKLVVRSLALLGPGQAVGLNETGFFSLTGKRTATVVAITPVVALYLSIPKFKGFSLANPHVSEIMRQNAANRVAE